MPACTRCKQSLSWGQTFYRTLIRKGDAVDCPFCGQKLYLTPRSKQRLFSILSFVPVLFVFLTIAQASETVMAAVLLLAAGGAIMITPFAVEVTDTEKPLF